MLDLLVSKFMGLRQLLAHSQVRLRKAAVRIPWPRFGEASATLTVGVGGCGTATRQVCLGSVMLDFLCKSAFGFGSYESWQGTRNFLQTLVAANGDAQKEIDDLKDKMDDVRERLLSMENTMKELQQPLRRRKQKTVMLWKAKKVINQKSVKTSKKD